MVERAILKVIQNYLEVIRHAGIHVNQAIIFGSHARREAQPDSDIDILVIAPEFDGTYDKKWVDLLWELRAKSDSRIEPIPVGKLQWQEDDASAILEIARREGQEVPLPFAA